MKGKAMMTVDAYPCSSELEEAAKRLYSAAGFPVLSRSQGYWFGGEDK